MEDSRTKVKIKEIISPYSPHIEVNLDNLLHNLKEISSLIPDKTEVMAVIKDCAYGCGSTAVARTLERDGGVNFFAVARPEEAFALRKAGIVGSIFVLGRATEDQLRVGFDNNLIFSLNDPSDLYRWKSYPLNVRFHINIDTGMSRMGLLPNELDEIINVIEDSPSLKFEGVYTHMACADEPKTTSVDQQLKLFRNCIINLIERGSPPLHIHYGNSATCMRFNPYECTLVRPGIALYGCKPDPTQNFSLNLKQVVSLKSRIVKMKKVPAHTAISYGGHYVTNCETWIATVALGYAHGYPRFLSSKGELLIGYRRYKVAGNVTMDYTMVDAGPNPDISIGDEVVAIGSQGELEIHADDIAVLGKTIGYETLCNLGASVDRVYLLNNKIVHYRPGQTF
ncbi:alanine racemase [Chitinispirillales bacterium ANBcel5]|uniref:alanine racemase n=1 Tax=Cellulosispirillum alkaliphilum TaxID=3039283 RepID=UPI002A58B155|nr:alanine racemase [Chitinispirillales bacterium ANBcel5]